MTLYAPLYPILLAVGAVFEHGDVLQAGRLLCAFFFGANVALLGLAVLICTEGSLSAMACTMCVFLVSKPIIEMHSMAMSDAPFISFALAAFVLMSFHVARPRLYLLLAASFSAGCAMATRYVGVTLLPPIVCTLLFFGNRSIKHKIADIFVATIVALLPIASWLIRNILATGTATNRTLAVHVVTFHRAQGLIDTLYGFTLPMSMPGSSWTRTLLFGVAMALFLILVSFLRRRNYIRRNANTVRIILPTICIVFFLTYIPFLLIYVSFVDAHVPFDSRILLPAFLTITVASVSLIWSLSSVLASRIVWYGFILFVVLSLIINSAAAIAVAGDIHGSGRGYTSRKWRNSETIASVTSLAKDVKIYSNGPDVIQVLTGRTATMIPFVTYPTTRKPNRDLDGQLQVMCSKVIGDEAVVVYFNEITWRWYLPTLKDLEVKCIMPVLARLDDGVIYGRSRAVSEQGATPSGDYATPHRR